MTYKINDVYNSDSNNYLYQSRKRSPNFDIERAKRRIESTVRIKKARNKLRPFAGKGDINFWFYERLVNSKTGEYLGYRKIKVEENLGGFEEFETGWTKRTIEKFHGDWEKNWETKEYVSEDGTRLKPVLGF